MLKSSARIGAGLAQRGRADWSMRELKMDSCYAPFRSGNTGIEYSGGQST
jgi:hypothetical protein